MRKLALVAVVIATLSGCSTIQAGQQHAREWACAPTTTLAQRRAALASVNAAREALFLPPRVAFDCDRDGAPDFTLTP